MPPYFMAIDQRTGQTFHGLIHPRKDLMNLLGYKSAQKMYQDSTTGKIYHVGYVIGPYWLTVYQVIPLRKES